jgi:hypothetical protein
VEERGGAWRSVEEGGGGWMSVEELYAAFCLGTYLPYNIFSASRHKKHPKKCLELKSYDDHYSRSEGDCKTRCSKDDKCRVVEYRADLRLCMSSDQRNFEKEKRCKDSGAIFVKGNFSDAFQLVVF